MWRKIYIIRHAESHNTFAWRYNRDHPDEKPIMMLSADKDGLSSTGCIQAGEVAKHIPENACVRCADSVRAKDTAFIINPKYEVYSELNELSELDYTDEHKNNLTIDEQIQNWVNVMLKPAEDPKTPVVIVSHAGIIGKSLRAFLPLDDTIRFAPANASMTVLGVDDNEKIVIHTLGSRVVNSNFWHEDDAMEKL